MATFAAPVRRGNFLYSSVLYADAGNENHHPRASIAELTALLRPAAAKGKGTKAMPPENIKDQVGHWYTAQLLHYGLQQTKDKNVAKVRLLNALNQGTLNVPAHIKSLELDMKREWEKENKNMKRTVNKPKAKPATGGGRFRTTHEEEENFTVLLSFSSSKTSTTNYHSVSQPSNQKKTPTKRKREDDSVPFQTPTPKARQVTQPRSKQLRVEWSPTYPSTARTPPKKSPKAIKSEPNTFKAEPSYDDYDDHDDYHSADDVTFSGTYSIICPTATRIFPSLNPNTLELTLSLDDYRGVWWANFFWGSWQCIIQMNPGPSVETLDQPCTLGWRLKDWDTGELRFGRGCTGQMTFYRNKTIQGLLEDVPGVGRIEFWGHRVGGIVGRMSADEFQDEWESFPRDVYGR